jgi:esterase/lipase
MNSILRSIILLLAICIISPLAKADYVFDLETLDHVLNNQESRFPDIVVGSEKHIRWFKDKQQSEIALVYIHGFSASRQELSPTTERLADRLKANVYYARLQGHGRSEDAMAEATVKGWKKDARQAYQIGKKIGKRVVLISTSTGGTLATWLAATEFDQAIVANVLVSPNFDVASNIAKIVTWPGGLTLAKWISGDYRSFTPMSEEHGRYWTFRYPIEAVLPMFDLLEEVQQLDKSKINTPHLVVYSPNDKVIDIDAIKTTIQEFTSAKVDTKLFLNSTDPYQHVLSGVACSPESTDEMVQLLDDYITRLR